MKILLLGSSGQLGQAFQELANSSAFPIGWEMKAWSRGDADLSNPPELIKKIQIEKPDLIINTAAYTQVDLAEKERTLCETINAQAPGYIASYCVDANIPLIHYSSDYVYAGEGVEPHVESENHAPGNYYGQTKAEGDALLQKSGCEHLIFRTSWVFSHVGKNFVKTMLRIGVDRPELRVVSDQVGSPSYAPDLAAYSLEALMRALELKAEGKEFPSGVYHLTNSGNTSWAGFAEAILPKNKIIGIPSSEYPTPAKRPQNSRLSLEKLKQTFGITPRPWQEALKECLVRLGEQNG